MLRRILTVSALLILLALPAQAATIDLLLTVDHYAPIIGPPGIGFSFRFFESSTNGWPGALAPGPYLAQGSAGLLPGLTSFNVSLNAESLDDVYFTADGGYFSGPGFQFLSLYAAHPPTGPVPDSLIFGYGPPWISLANLGSGFSGDLQYFFGYSNGPIGTWTVTPATAVPEPTSLFLIGSGVVALAANRYRKSRAGRSQN